MQKGFTLIELIAVMIIIGILAVVVVPRFADQSAFETMGFHDETLSQLRFAQKTAIAQRRTVCLALNPTGVALTIVPTALSVDCSTAVPLQAPNALRGGTGLSSAPSSFSYLASGATDQSSNIAITISGADPITVDAVTGYAY